MNFLLKFRCIHKICLILYENNVIMYYQLSYFIGGYGNRIKSRKVLNTLKNMKRSGSLLCLLLSAAICGTTAVFPAASAAEFAPPSIVDDTVTADSSGVCGQNASWTLRSGTLTISGTGNMVNWESASVVPWSKYMSEIRNVVIQNGITNVGRAAFYNATNLTSVTIPDSVTAISSNAFQRTALSSVTLSVYVTSIGLEAFAGCQNLREIKIYAANCNIVNLPETINNSGKGNFNGTVFGVAGSAVESTVKSYNYNFSALQDVPKATTKATTTTTKTTTTTTKATTKATTAKPTTTAATTVTTTTTTFQWNWGWPGWPPQQTQTTKPEPPTPGTQPAPILFGDANLDKKVDISDAVLIMQSLSNPSLYGINGSEPSHITERGKDSADVSSRGDGVTNHDALAIQKYTLDLVTSLPC